MRLSLPLRLPLSVLKHPLENGLKAVSFLLGDGTLLSGRPELLPLDLDRDFAEIERLLALEEWPFLRGDLDASHAQPRSVGLVARREGRMAGFFCCHHFGDVGYLDMMIITPQFRRAGITRPLYVRTLKEMKHKGLRAWVVHTTNDSAPLIRLLGFTPGQTFTLLGRDAGAGPRQRRQMREAHLTARRTCAGPLADPPPAAPGESIRALGAADTDALVELDGEVFGIRRPTWIGALLAQPGTRFLGLHRDGTLVASLCLRPRRNGAVCIDGVCARERSHVQRLLHAALAAGTARAECFVRDGSDLDGELRRLGFTVPAFFTKIGPLVEWRKGKTGGVGLSPLTRCLSWF